MKSLCPFKNIFGEPGAGIRTFRIFDISIFDLGFVLAFAAIISIMNNWNFVKVSLLLIVLGVIFHKLFCVKTGLNKMLGLA